MKKKKCEECQKFKKLSLFPKWRKRCKICYKEQKKIWDANYYIENKEKILEYHKEYNENNKEEKSKYDEKRYQENSKEIKEKTKKWREKNSDKVKENKNKRDRDKRKNDPLFRLRQYISKRINGMLKSNGSSKNGKSILKFLPYTFDELISHITSLFATWMTWKNQGVYRPSEWNDLDPSTWKWQLDHIIPQSDFPYTSMEDDNFKKCWALSNLRPLSAKQNQLDGATKIRHKKDK